MNRSKHSQETIERMKANAEAARKRLERLNAEYRVRQEALRLSHSKAKPSGETFAQAVSRIARESHISI